VRESGAAALRLGIAVAVLAAAYLGMAWFLGRHVPANTTVAGVPIGGMSPAAAESTLQRALASRERPRSSSPPVTSASSSTLAVQASRSTLRARSTA
jgi:hypothetical protein